MKKEADAHGHEKLFTQRLHNNCGIRRSLAGILSTGRVKIKQELLRRLHFNSILYGEKLKRILKAQFEKLRRWDTLALKHIRSRQTSHFNELQKFLKKTIKIFSMHTELPAGEQLREYIKNGRSLSMSQYHLSRMAERVISTRS